MADEQNQQTEAPLQSEQEQVNNEQPTQDPSDKLTPDHPRFREVLDRAKNAEGKVEELQQQLADLKEQISQRQEETGNDQLTDDEERALDRIDRGLRSKGYVTQEELKAERNALKLDKLSDKYSGGNGLPKFNSVEVVTYAKRNGFGDNFEAAYRDMHYQAFVQYEAKKLTQEVNPPTTERAGGGKPETLETEISAEDISKMSDEEYERNRSKILGSIKSSLR